MKDLIARTPVGEGIHVGNEVTFPKITALAKQLIAVDQSAGWEIRALIIVATEIVAVAEGQRCLQHAADALLSAGTVCGFHVGLQAVDLVEHVREGFQMELDVLEKLAAAKAGVE